MPTQKLGRLLGMTLMMFALAIVATGAADAGTVVNLEFEWN